MSLNIDDEWETFNTSANKHSYQHEDEYEDDCESPDNISLDYPVSEYASTNILDEIAPKASSIYISTKTNISYLNMPIDLKTVFWKIPVMPYSNPANGVIKKQMKFNSLLQEELDDIQERIKHEECVDENIITSINNPAGRIKFKDIRKVSIGVSKKDLMSYRCKKKSAFYNCFVMIMRIKLSGVFKEFHVKIFNTGKLEIPGIQGEEAFQKILTMVIDVLQPHIETALHYQENTTETVLINSNFNCGFYINRETLFDILKYKYKIQCIYDPCSYPGIQCKFYYNSDDNIQTTMQSGILDGTADRSKIKEISFMIFRTGSVLIVGKCEENVLYVVYEFLKTMLATEYNMVGKKIHICEGEGKGNYEKEKKTKTRRKQITVNIC